MKNNWILYNAEDYTLGRLATEIATILMGKHKTGFVRHENNGDYVVVLNAEKIRTTGNKEKLKVYQSYSGFPSGLSEITLGNLRRVKPEEIIRHAVRGMLPKNKLQAKMLKRLRVIVGNENPYADKFKN